MITSSCIPPWDEGDRFYTIFGRGSIPLFGKAIMEIWRVLESSQVQNAAVLMELNLI